MYQRHSRWLDRRARDGLRRPVEPCAPVCRMTTTNQADTLNHLPPLPERRDVGIGVVGAGFIVRDCHLVAYATAGFRVVGITSRSIETAREVAALRGVPKVYSSVEEMLDDPAIEVVDVAVPPTEQPGVIDRVLAHPRRVRGILAQKPLAMSYGEAAAAGRGVRAGRRACSRSTRTCGTITRCGP